MRIFNARLSLFIGLCLTAVICLWFSQQSLNRYWQQTYHRPSPLAPLNRFALWRAGGELHNAANAVYARWLGEIAAIDQRISAAEQNDAVPAGGLADGAPLLVETAQVSEREMPGDGQIRADAEQAEAPPQAVQDSPEPLTAVAMPEEPAQPDPATAQAPPGEPSSVAQTAPETPAASAPQDSGQTAAAVPPAEKAEETAAQPVQIQTAADAAPPRRPPLIGARDLTRQAAVPAVSAPQDNEQTTAEAPPTAAPAATAAQDSGQTAAAAPPAEEVEERAAQPVQIQTAADAAPPRRPPLIGARDLTRQTAAQNNEQAAAETASAAAQAENTTEPPAASLPQDGGQTTVDAPPAEKAEEAAAQPAQTQLAPDAVPPRRPPLIGARDLTRQATPTATAAQNNEQMAVETASAAVQAENTAEPPAASLPQDGGQTTAEAPPAEKAEEAAAPPAQTQSAPDATAQSGGSAALPEFVRLAAGDKVLLIGDSLMQGVAPYVQQSLLQQYHVQSINLSRQSTGLSYPGFFNWPAEVEKALAADAAIKAVVVFLGPNDPWDFPDPDKGDQAPYLKFKSPAWEAVYRSRISRIAEAAAGADAGLIWLGLPFMQAEPLNGKLQYLDGLMRSEMRGKGIFVPTKYILTGGAPGYVDSIEVDGKALRVRSKDGIHFTPAGQRQLAVAVLRRLRFGEEQ